jgi:hypothetical protein
MKYNVQVSIRPVVGGFIVDYPTFVEGVEQPVNATEVATSIGKAMRIAKTAVEAFSLVKKSADDTE